MPIEFVKKDFDDILADFGIKAQVVDFVATDYTAIFDVELGPKTRVQTFEKYAEELGLRLKALAPPVITTVFNKGVVRLEFVLNSLDVVKFNSVDLKKRKALLPLFVGRSTQGKDIIVELENIPHVLVAGSSGSGKSVMMHSMINSLASVANINNIKLSLIDPKRVEFSLYDKCNFLYDKTAYTSEEVEEKLSNIVSEMDRRFSLLTKHGARSIIDVRNSGKCDLPFIVLIIDELADITKFGTKESRELLLKLAQKGRAAGIHIIVSTQRPSADIVDGDIKANFPGRVCCKVSASVDSRVILGQNGAEKLTEKGMAIVKTDKHPFVQIKGSFISAEELDANIKSHKSRWWNRPASTTSWNNLW